jgi:hypothetical protein
VALGPFEVICSQPPRIDFLHFDSFRTLVSNTMFLPAPQPTTLVETTTSNTSGYELFIRWTVFVVVLAFTFSGLAWCTFVGYMRRRRSHDGSIPLVLLRPMPDGRVRATRAVVLGACESPMLREEYFLANTHPGTRLDPYGLDYRKD